MIIIADIIHIYEYTYTYIHISLCIYVYIYTHIHIHIFCLQYKVMASDGDPAQDICISIRRIGKRVMLTKAVKILFRPILHLTTVIKNTLFSVALS